MRCEGVGDVACEVCRDVRWRGCEEGESVGM